MLGQVSVAAATAVVGYDLASNTVWQQSGKPRIIRGIALAGSAAALDTKAELFVGANRVGEVYNSATGAPTREHLFPVGAVVPAGEEVHCFVTDAAASNPVTLILDFQE